MMVISWYEIIFTITTKWYILTHQCLIHKDKGGLIHGFYLKGDRNVSVIGSARKWEKISENVPG